MAIRDLEGEAAGVQHAEVAGHRRTLAGAAHGTVTIEELGRFEVRASTNEEGRVDVHVSADREPATALLDAHAVELRADVRVEIPHAFVEVDTSSADGSPRHASDANHRGDRHEHRHQPAAPPSSAPSDAQRPSWNRRSARVRIVL